MAAVAEGIRRIRVARVAVCGVTVGKGRVTVSRVTVSSRGIRIEVTLTETVSITVTVTVTVGVLRRGVVKPLSRQETVCIRGLLVSLTVSSSQVRVGTVTVAVAVSLTVSVGSGGVDVVEVRHIVVSAARRGQGHHARGRVGAHAVRRCRRGRGVSGRGDGAVTSRDAVGSGEKVTVGVMSIVSIVGRNRVTVNRV